MIRLTVCAFLFSALCAGEDIGITDPARLELKGAQAQPSTYRGHVAIKVSPATQDAGLAVIRNLAFHDGTIDVDAAGSPAANADATARGFIGVAFRVVAGGARYENIYIRPTNGRADDQLRRNHSTQYESIPDWPWFRLRKETPGVYESYADLVAGEWTHLRITVHGINAALYVNGAEQSCLVIHDLKLGDGEGAIALWVGPGTDGYFRNLQVTR